MYVVRVLLDVAGVVFVLMLVCFSDHCCSCLFGEVRFVFACHSCLIVCWFVSLLVFCFV